jgi:hypothetical protein
MWQHLVIAPSLQFWAISYNLSTFPYQFISRKKDWTDLGQALITLL